MFNYNNQNNNFLGNNGNMRNSQSGVNDFETLQNARRDLIGELQAIIEYDDHLHKTNNEIAKATWENIRNKKILQLIRK